LAVVYHIRFVLALASECKLVLWLSVRNLVDSEPLVGGSEKTWEVTLDILDVVELRSEWVVNINHNNLPVSLLLIEESHDTEDLDLLDLAGITNKFTNLANIKRVVVTLSLGFGVNAVWVFPGLIEPYICLATSNSKRETDGE
jgi:hypothetical protein